MLLTASNLVHLPEQDESLVPESELLLMDHKTSKRVLESLHLSSWLNQVLCLCLCSVAKGFGLHVALGATKRQH